MEATPLIGVPVQTLQAIEGIPQDLPHAWVMNASCFRALAAAGGAPVMVPLLVADVETLRAVYEALDGVFLAGGVDVDPGSYRAGGGAASGSTDLDRDGVEILLTQWARAEGKPVFGVGRGLQIINVAHGGSLVQDCTAGGGGVLHACFPAAGYAPDHPAHEVRVEDGTRLRDIFPEARLMVNSMHRQGVMQVAEGLTASALAPDGLIEGLEAPGEAFCVGVQWHPELLLDTDAGSRRVFSSFTAAARVYREQRAPRSGTAETEPPAEAGRSTALS